MRIIPRIILPSGGPELAGQMIKAGLVDQYHLFANPIVRGGRKPRLPRDVFPKLELLDERRFQNEVVYVCYRARTWMRSRHVSFSLVTRHFQSVFQIVI